jgi:23S rRNA-/tRNA-specific pseudouridylate synthase
VTIDARELFDPPCPDPPPVPMFRDWYGPGPCLTGPIPPRLAAGVTVAEFLAQLLARRHPPETAAALVEFGSVWLDSRVCLDPEAPVAGHAEFRINPPAYGFARFYEADPARIVFEDRDILVYRKESGRPSQGVPHDAHNNVLAALSRLLARRGEPAELRLPHRLDADTSGLLLLAKTREAASSLGRAFQSGRVDKRYLALGLGPAPVEKSFSVTAPLAKEGPRYVARPGGPGVAARTDFTVPEWADPERIGERADARSAVSRSETTEPPAADGWPRTLFLAAPRTGRTHQIRVHMAWAGWPIAGDRFYGRPDEYPKAPRLRLASVVLAFPHPRTGEEMRLSLL